MLRYPLFGIAAMVVLAALLQGCGSDGSFSARLDKGTGTLNVHLTDAPIDLSNVRSVDVTITGVIVYPGDEMLPDPAPGSPLSLMSHPETFDLLTLTGGATTLLASGEVPAGTYSRIRLEISDATLTYNDGTTRPLKIEPGKVDVPIRFEVGVDDEEQLTLDFDAAASVMVNETAGEELILRPVVTPVM
jgi:hypothetical protein